MAAAFALWVMRLRGTADHRLQTAVVAPTARVVDKVIQPKLADALPREIIARKVGRPFPTWNLVNGVDISFISGEAVFEGEDLAALWVDEIQTLAREPTRFQNYMARLRDKRAQQLALFASGLPEAGWVRDTFDPERIEDPKVKHLRHLTLMGTKDNPHLPEDMVAQFLASCPSGYEEAYIYGGWMPAEGALYVMFSDDNIVPDRRWDKEAPVSVGIDIGNTAAAVVGQYESIDGQGQSVLIGGSIVKKGCSLGDLCVDIRNKYASQLVPGKSAICVDPTIRRDELERVWETFPRLQVVKRPKSDPFYHVEPGQRLVQAAMKNAAGQRHLHVIKSCNKEREGIIAAWQNTRISPITGKRVKDNKFDHSEDAGRYLINHMLGDRGFAPEVKV